MTADVEDQVEKRLFSPTEAKLIGLYLLIALARQVAHDVRTILRWAQ